MIQTLNANDRCDACGSRAYVSVVISGMILLFCAHHYHRFEEKLRSKVLLDERWALKDAERSRVLVG